MTGDGHSHVNRIDGLVTISHIEGHNREVGVCICKLFRGQAHVRGTGIRAGSFCCTAEGEISFRVERIADLNIIPADTVFGSVIILSVVMAGNGHGDVDWINSLVTVSHVEDDLCEVAVYIGKLFPGQIHVRSTGIGAGSFSSAAEGEVSFRIERIADCHIIP